MYGLGVDNVLQYDVVLADGQHLEANECTNPELYRTLRGGGGGFGVVTAVHYKLHPASPLQQYTWTPCNANSSDLSDPKTAEHWDLLFRWAGKWDRRWSSKFLSCSAIYSFLGTHEEALASDFYKDATNVFGEPEHDSFRSLLHFKLKDASPQEDGDISWKHTKDRQLRPDFSGNWLIPKAYLVEKPIEARNLFMNAMANGSLCPIHGEYLLLGTQNEISESSDPTSVNPGLRKAAMQMSICDDDFMDKMMQMFPDSGVGINHAPANLKNWQTKLWGNKYSSLLAMKKQVDPHGLFRGQQLVGSELFAKQG